MKHLLALLVSLSLALSGCMRSLAPSHPWGHAGLPNRNAGYAWLAKLPPKKAAQEISALLQKLAGRGGFALTPAQFDRLFRRSRGDYSDLQDVRGVDRLAFPQSHHPAAAFSYVVMGLAAELKGDLGAAARGYWAALGLTSVTFGSRLQREQIREAAYAGLTRLAMRRNQPEWGALLAVCANMAHTYTTSDQAAKQHAEFYDVLEANVRAQRRAEAQEAAAHRAMITQGIVAGLGAATTIAQGATGNISQSAMTEQLQGHLQQAGEIAKQSRELDDAMKQTMSSISSSVGELREVAVEDVPDIEAGREFIARQVAWYLATADDPGPYLDAVAAYAQHRPPIRHEVNAMRAAMTAALARGEPPIQGSVEALKHLVSALLEAERHVASFERFGQLPGPRYLAAVCNPESGHAVACYLAATDTCRAGIDEGCVTLTLLAMVEARQHPNRSENEEKAR